MPINYRFINDIYKNKALIISNLMLLTLLVHSSITQAQNVNQDINTGAFQELEHKKSLIKTGDQKAVIAYQRLIEKADSLLTIEPFSVVHKTGIPPSNSKHDYMSIGPYWWPNPETENGLPYIRKDGEINPETRNNFTDFVEKKNFIATIGELTEAYYLSNEKKYVHKGIELIKVWFLDDATKMNPNINYGQYVPGKSIGRCFGIIEFSGLKNITRFLQLAKSRNTLDKNTEKGMHQWFTDYSNWLQHSKLGKEALTRENNHGTHYDLQLLDILWYLNQEDAVKKHLTTITKSRIFSQIEPDGSQPLELKRTKSFSYSSMNLHGFMKLVRLGEKVGVHLWSFQSEDGRSLKKAYQYMVPYLTKEKEWKYKQISSIKSSEDKLIEDLNYVSQTLKDSSFDHILELIHRPHHKH